LHGFSRAALVWPFELSQSRTTRDQQQQQDTDPDSFHD